MPALEKKPDNRERIVEAAFSVLMKSGLPPLSFDTIAAEAGTSRQLVRYYFKSADDLMLALCDRLADSYRQALIDNATRLEGPDRLSMFLDFYFDLLDGAEKPKDDQAYDAMMSLAGGSDRIRENLRGQYSLLGQVLCHEFRVAHPELSLRVCEELSYLFVCLMYGHWKMVASLGVSPAHNRITRGAMDRLIRDYGQNDSEIPEMTKIWATDG
jgi:AcrR family transcriptional regulator